MIQLYLMYAVFTVMVIVILWSMLSRWNNPSKRRDRPWE